MRRDVSKMFSSWGRFTRKLIDKIERPRFVGSFTEEEAKMKGMRLAIGSFDLRSNGIALKIYLLVDESDGIVADAKFQAIGPPALLGAAEGALEFFMRKNYDQISRISADLLDKHFRDKVDQEAFPQEEYSSLNWVLEAVEQATSQCMDIPLSDAYVPTPVHAGSGEEAKPYPNWDELTHKQQLGVIEEVIASDIRPYIELDAGGIEIVSLTEGRELVIAYQGACTTCYSSIGSTLQAIQGILSAKIHPEIRVIPDSSFLEPSS
jgi:NifU-like protein